jgi:UPF0148 protein
MDEDEMLQKITRLLERGGTMLASHHDCGAPLFRCQGEVVCPICSFAGGESAEALAKPPARPASDERRQKDETDPTGRRDSDVSHLKGPLNDSIKVSDLGSDFPEGNIPEEKAPKDDTPQIRLPEGGDPLRARARLSRVLLAKLSALTGSLEQEQDLDKLKKQMDCIEALLKVLRSLQ